MKKIFILSIAGILFAIPVFAQGSSNISADDQSQEEKNLQILSKKLVHMKKEMDKFAKDMSAAYSDVQTEAEMRFTDADVKVDIVENDKDFTVLVDLPGMEKDKIDVVLEKGRLLKISGQREMEKKATAPGVVRQERVEGRLERAVELPAECKSEGIKASYKDGVLEIIIPKSESAKKEAVKVKVQ